MKVDTFKIINLGNHGVSQESILFKTYSIKESHSVSEPTTFIWVQYFPPDISVGAVEMDLKELSGSYVKAQSQGEILSWVPVVSSGSAELQCINGKFSVRAAWKFSFTLVWQLCQRQVPTSALVRSFSSISVYQNSNYKSSNF